MDMHRLRCIVSLKKFKNVTRAAEACYIAQSTMSNTIASIEAELGTTLFTRTNRGLTLTDAGEIFAKTAEEIVERYDEALMSLQTPPNNSECFLTIGFNSATLGSSIAPIMTQFKKMHPAVNIRLCKHSLSKLTECLNDDLTDVVFGNQFEARNNPHLRYEPIAETYPCVYMPKQHSLANKSSVTIDDLRGETLLHAAGDGNTATMSAAAKVLKAAGVPFCIEGIVHNEEAIISMVEAGLGIYPASTWYQHAFEEKAICVPLELNVENMQIVIIWKNPTFRNIARDLASCARKIFKSSKNDATIYRKD